MMVLIVCRVHKTPLGFDVVLAAFACAESWKVSAIDLNRDGESTSQLIASRLPDA